MFTLENLDAIIAQRANSSAAESYTKTLLAKGVAKCARKFGEEAVEATVAALVEDEAALRAEAADVIYHLLVLLRARGVAWADVLAELEGRTSQSGLQEKASRTG